ncbi:MAG: hypothetical protein K9K66_15180 [Desulfarculaceae bacterium]|nr:hypothetical protein [Desulfarculaceae bacterium]MCF8074243.1 hypothetical protein [Desulfarculaceae bacterium]MCF8102998.1 hypothetical protein [Desulfarculaceae bacterium]MCF8117129.1 hypothetical protein [Desulfarculaceae bacterium]
MFLDFSHITIGEPEAVFDRLSGQLGRLNFSSHNLKIGITARPRRMPAALDNGWRIMRLLWCTHSPAMARQMDSLLRAWDRKLYLPARPDEPPGGPWWAFALLS